MMVDADTENGGKYQSEPVWAVSNNQTTLLPRLAALENPYPKEKARGVIPTPGSTWAATHLRYPTHNPET